MPVDSIAILIADRAMRGVTVQWHNAFRDAAVRLFPAARNLFEGTYTLEEAVSLLAVLTRSRQRARSHFADSDDGSFVLPWHEDASCKVDLDEVIVLAHVWSKDKLVLAKSAPLQPSLTRIVRA